VKPALQALYIFQGVILVLSAQKFLQESCLALRSSDLYKFLRALKHVLEIYLRAWFLHLFTLRFKAFTWFLKAFKFGYHHGAYLVFGRNGGKHSWPISASLLQISVILLSSLSFVVALFTQFLHCWLHLLTFS
jgi:hypothetical protein